MSNTRTIGGLQRGPDFDREVYEPQHVEKVTFEEKHKRKAETNDPLIRAAVEAAGEVSKDYGDRVDIQFERNSGMVVMTILDATGERVIRRIPPEEMIRMAQRIKENRDQLLENIM